MPSPKTMTLNHERSNLRKNTIRYLTPYEKRVGPNRAQRRRNKYGLRLRSKMRPDRWQQVYNWKYPKSKKTA